ncbi:hypothetical protein HPB51_005083 [Rhipicephalus microplus]|uniref:Uncharacterized protein n=1 Tax=Rhipicephalus microplus TaxID=6941 RepID=A0A9J6DLP9_RHIMP|nr:hypothetical protein HPB51_005083 [Rhipicephalus microplus]
MAPVGLLLRALSRPLLLRTPLQLRRWLARVPVTTAVRRGIGPTPPLALLGAGRVRGADVVNISRGSATLLRSRPVIKHRCRLCKKVNTDNLKEHACLKKHRTKYVKQVKLRYCLSKLLLSHSTTANFSLGDGCYKKRASYGESKCDYAAGCMPY